MTDVSYGGIGMAATRSGMRRWAPHCALVISVLWLAFMPAGCTRQPVSPPAAATPGATCTPNGQDRFVYDPGRLQVMQACIHVTGVVDERRLNPDGDTVILLHLDPPYQDLLTPGNSGAEYHGDIGVEAVC